MITWHATGTGSYTAAVRVGAVCVARLHAHADRWELEHLDSTTPGMTHGPANSATQAKRAALQALSEVLGQAGFAVDVALRAG